MGRVKKVILLAFLYFLGSSLLWGVSLYFPYLFESFLPFSFSEPSLESPPSPKDLSFFRTYRVTPGSLEFWVKGGKEQGITEGAFVLTEKGRVVGKVIKVGKRYSLVRSVYHPSFKVPAVLEGTDIVGIAKGKGDKVVFEFRTEKEDIPQEGRLVTLEFEGFSFPGLFLGEISRVKFNPETREGKIFLTPLSLPIFLYIVIGE